MEIPWVKCMGCDLPTEDQMHFLPCLHVFCSDACLEKEGLTESNRCKKCSRKYNLDQVKRGVKLDDFLKWKRNLQCQFCDRTNIPVDSYCTDCEKNLCVECTAYHPHLRKEGHHWLDRNLEPRIVKLKQCPIHETKDVEHLCFTCQSKVCEDCLPGHPDHEVFRVAEELDKIHLRINSFKEIRETAMLAIAKLEGKLESLQNAEWKDYKTAVNNLFKQAKKIVLEEGRKRRGLNMTCVENKVKDLHDILVLLDVKKIGQKMDMDDFWMINAARQASALPSSTNISFNKETLEDEDRFDAFVEKGQSLVGLLPELQVQTLVPWLSGLSPLPGPSSLIEHLTSSTGTENGVPTQHGKKSRCVAFKSTGGKSNSRPLAMPHLKQLEIKNGDFKNDSTSESEEERQIEMLSSTFSSTSSLSMSTAGPSRKREIKNSIDPLESSEAEHLGGTIQAPITHENPPNKRARQQEKGNNAQEDHFHGGTTSTETIYATRSENIPVNQYGLRSRGFRVRNSTGVSASRNALAHSSNVLEAPENSYLKMDAWMEDHYPIQKDDRTGKCCAICAEGGSLVWCDSCKRSFHYKCHIPVLIKKELPEGNWYCNYHTTPEILNEELARIPAEHGSEWKPLSNENSRQFALACNFMIAIHKIPERPTMQWKFPEKYYEEFGVTPYHLDYLRMKLCLATKTGKFRYYSSVTEFLLAFQQMLQQAFRIYRVGNEHRQHAVSFYEQFNQVVQDYYPEHQGLFENILQDQ